MTYSSAHGCNSKPSFKGSYNFLHYRVQNLHKYLEIVCMDFNYSSSDFSKKHDLVILTLIRYYNYHIDGYSLFRNDGTSKSNDRPY